MRPLRTALLALVLLVGCKSTPPSPAAPAATPVAVAPPGVLRVVLEVDGDVDAALEVARRRVDALRAEGLAPLGQGPMVRRAGEAIEIELPLAAGAPCESDEAQAWVESTTRTVSRSGSLGFHRADGPADVTFLELVRATGVEAARSAREELSGKVVVDATAEQAKTIVAALKLPRDQVAFVQETSPGNTEVLLFRSAPSLSGGDLEDASVEIDEHTGQPAVHLDFTKAGGERFGELTQEIVEQPLAIVFEGELASAPVVREKIAGGRARIDLGAGSRDAMREARELAAVLRAGDFDGKVRVRESGLICK